MAAPFAAYFDRSELNAPANVMAVAGYMSTADAWHQFEKEWRRAFDEYGLEWFHMTDFETRRGPYANWDNSRRRRFLRRLIGIVGVHASVGIGVGLVLPDYKH